MITHETEIEGFDARSWHRLLTLFVPGAVSHAPQEWHRGNASHPGWCVVFHDGRKVLRAVHSVRGAIAVDAWAGRETLAALAHETGARFTLGLRTGALEELSERLGGRVTLDDDVWTTLWIVLGAVRELMDEGLWMIHPAPAPVPLPPVEVLRRAWDVFLPDGRTAVVCLFDGDEIATSVVLRRRGAALDRVEGPELLRRRVGPLGGDFHRDYRVIRAAVERDLGPLAFGLFTRVETFHDLLRAEEAGAWARAIAVRDVVADPMPSWLALAAGASAVRGAAQASRALVEGIEFLEVFTPLAKRVRDLAEMAGVADLSSVLGFDPLRMLAGFLRRSREEPDDDRDP